MEIIDILREYLEILEDVDMTDEQSFVVQSRLPCPSCSSSDAYSSHSDGHGYCFSCGYTSGEGSDQKQNKELKQSITQGITPESSEDFMRKTLRKFNVRVDNGPVIGFPYHDQAGRIVGTKKELLTKSSVGTAKNSDNQLFGQQLFGGGKSIVVTEGELMRFLCGQCRPKWPVLSVPQRCQGCPQSTRCSVRICSSLMKSSSCSTTTRQESPRPKNAFNYSRLVPRILFPCLSTRMRAMPCKLVMVRLFVKLSGINAIYPGFNR